GCPHGPASTGSRYTAGDGGPNRARRHREAPQTARKKRRVRRLARIVVLYRETIRSAADAHGRFTGHVRITYTPSRPAQAGLVVLSRAGPAQPPLTCA